MLQTALCLAIAVQLATAAPGQAHLAWTRQFDELRLVWVSGTAGGSPTVIATQDSINTTFTGSSHTYTIDELCSAPANEPGNWQEPGQINVVTLTGLTPGREVTFKFGDAVDGFRESSTAFRRTTSANLVIMADMGRASASIDRLALEVNETDVVLFPGDLSYSMGRKGVWAEWFALVDPVFSRVPVQFGAGNHDVLQLQGDERFWPAWGSYELDSGTQGECGVPFQQLVAMDGEDAQGNRAVNNNFTSVDLPGLAHIITLSSEHNFTRGSPQARWLLKDLSTVNRTLTPWVLLQFHRPLYDSTFNALLPEQAATRAILEPLLEAGGVDLMLTGHVHDYQSMHCRIYNGTCRGQSAQKPTSRGRGLRGRSDSASSSSSSVLPSGPVGRPVMLVGGGGKTSGVRAWMDAPDWLAARTDGLGYARFRGSNASWALWQWVFNTNGSTFDTHWMQRAAVQAAEEARRAGDPSAPPTDAPAAVEAWRRQRVAHWWWCEGGADSEGRVDAGLGGEAREAAATGVRLVGEAQEVLDAGELLALWGLGKGSVPCA